MAYGGQVIIDRNGKTWMRFDTAGTVIGQYTAMTVWDGKLILGRGTASRPDLCYADWDTETEEGAVSSNASNPLTMPGAIRTKNLDFGLPDIQKQITRVVLKYRDNGGWDSETVTLKYRLDSNLSSGVIPSWTTLGFADGDSSITLGTISGTKTIAQTKIARKIPNPFYEIQFQIEGDNHMDILGINIYYNVLPVK